MSHRTFQIKHSNDRKFWITHDTYSHQVNQRNCELGFQVKNIKQQMPTCKNFFPKKICLTSLEVLKNIKSIIITKETVQSHLSPSLFIWISQVVPYCIDTMFFILLHCNIASIKDISSFSFLLLPKWQIICKISIFIHHNLQVFFHIFV